MAAVWWHTYSLACRAASLFICTFIVCWIILCITNPLGVQFNSALFSCWAFLQKDKVFSIPPTGKKNLYCWLHSCSITVRTSVLFFLRAKMSWDLTGRWLRPFSVKSVLLRSREELKKQKKQLRVNIPSCCWLMQAALDVISGGWGKFRWCFVVCFHDQSK